MLIPAWVSIMLTGIIEGALIPLLLAGFVLFAVSMVLLHSSSAFKKPDEREAKVVANAYRICFGLLLIIVAVWFPMLADYYSIFNDGVFVSRLVLLIALLIYIPAYHYYENKPDL